MARYTVNIKEETYSKIKEYCNSNALKISAWVEKILMAEIDKRTNKN